MLTKYYGPSSRSLKAVQMEPERLPGMWERICETDEF